MIWPQADQSAFTAAPVCTRQRAPRRILAGGPKGRTHRIVCNNLKSPCVRSGCGHAWTPRRDFAVSISVTQSLTVGSAAFQKAGTHRVTLRADPVRARHGPTDGPARVAGGREPRSPLGAGAARIGQFIHPTRRGAGAGESGEAGGRRIT